MAKAKEWQYSKRGELFNLFCRTVAAMHDELSKTGDINLEGIVKVKQGDRARVDINELIYRIDRGFSNPKSHCRKEKK